MKYSLLVRQEAEADLQEAYSYYESCGEGLGRDFLQCIETVAHTIQVNPHLYRAIHKNIMRCMLNKFPYGVYYTIKNETVVIVAVMHVRRDPIRWQKRI